MLPPWEGSSFYLLLPEKIFLICILIRLSGIHFYFSFPKLGPLSAKLIIAWYVFGTHGLKRISKISFQRNEKWNPIPPYCGYRRPHFPESHPLIQKAAPFLLVVICALAFWFAPWRQNTLVSTSFTSSPTKRIPQSSNNLESSREKLSGQRLRMDSTGVDLRMQNSSTSDLKMQGAHGEMFPMCPVKKPFWTRIFNR